jgi:superfamily II DNA or RNA helicase
LKKKTFVLVHKEFLLNQWIERISDFLPNSRIGKVQGDVVDIENKDIVIGMIQSISMKQYPLDLFDSFGFVILDESHRCPSRVFSKALAKINCTYMLGLSATPNRKDGLTKVLKWFIGDIIFQRVGKSALNSELIRYVYCCKDEVYSKELTGYYGKVNSAGMINNIASFMPRTNFIVEKTVECIRDMNRQVLILSDRKEQLRDIERAMVEKGIEIGYYIGGMKQSALELSTKKLAILATYQMAAEGLDIATIDTIVLATPKTDIEQAVGRIRPKQGDSERNTPLVIDIVDEFSIFENQAFKRLAFYKKKNYEITTTKVAKDGKVLSSYTYSASAEGAEESPVPPPPKPQRKGFGFSKLKQEERKSTELFSH